MTARCYSPSQQQCIMDRIRKEIAISYPMCMGLMNGMNGKKHLDKVRLH